MIKGIYDVSKNLGAKGRNMEIVANNVANINTTGYKRELPFSEVMSRFDVAPIKQLTDQSQGNLLYTANPLDLSISGQGYFTLKNANGQIEYSRNGRFKISEEGFLENEEGFRVMGKKGEIDFNDFTLDKSQTISVGRNGEIKIGDNIIDDLQIAVAPNPYAMERKKGLNFVPDEGVLPDALEDSFEIQQGYLEESNSNPVIEMQAMIDISREFESAQKMMNYLDQSLEQATQIGKV